MQFAGQLDEISTAIGRVEGRLDGIDRYIHDNRHEVANVSSKVDALGTKITRDIAAVEERIKVRMELFETRMRTVELAQAGSDGAKNVWLEILQSPIIAGAIGGALALLAMAWAYFSGHLK